MSSNLSLKTLVQKVGQSKRILNFILKNTTSKTYHNIQTSEELINLIISLMLINDLKEINNWIEPAEQYYINFKIDEKILKNASDQGRFEMKLLSIDVKYYLYLLSMIKNQRNVSYLKDYIESIEEFYRAEGLEFSKEIFSSYEYLIANMIEVEDYEKADYYCKRIIKMNCRKSELIPIFNLFIKEKKQNDNSDKSISMLKQYINRNKKELSEVLSEGIKLTSCYYVGMKKDYSVIKVFKSILNGIEDL